MTAPIFIVGANRSGTTLLRLLLNAHSTLAVPDEINYFYGFTGYEVRYELWDEPQLSDAAYTAFVDRFLSANQDTVPHLNLTALRRDILDGPQDFRRPYQMLLERWAAQQGKTRWGEKTPGNIYHANILIDMFPDARFIHLVRDPRAGVASMNRVSFFSADAAFNALNRHKIMTHGRDWLAQAVPSSQRTEVRYEDLVGAPEATLRRLCTFVDLPYEPGMLHFHRNARRFMVDEAAQSYNRAATRPISTNRTEAWRSALSDDEVAVVERVCQSEMAEFGYVPEGRSLSWRGAALLALKRAYWWLQWARVPKDRHFMVLSPMFSQTRTRLRRLLRGLTGRWTRVFSTKS